MIRKLTILSLLISISASLFGQFESFQSFEALDSLSQVYLHANDTDSAVLTMEYALETYPEEGKKATYILGILYARTGKDSKALNIWEHGHKNGYYYGLNNRAYREHFKGNEKFEVIAKTDSQIGKKLDSLSHMEYELVKPQNFSEDKKYPVIFIFHGNSRNIEKAKETWTSEVLENEFIVVYLQSYIHFNSLGYRWSFRDKKTETQLRKIYDDIMQYNFTDHDKIIFAGMSAGGIVALDYAFSNSFSCSGLLLNCPVVPNIEDKMVQDFVSSDKEIVIISGETDFALEKQQDLISRLKDLNGKAEIIIIPEMGHNFPDNFSNLLDEYLKSLMD